MTEKKEEEDITKSDMLSFFVSESETTAESSRTFGLYGDVDEEMASSVVYTLISLKESIERENKKKAQKLLEGEQETQSEEDRPIKMIISTHGGSAHDMFAIYDIMRLMGDIEIETMGIGKVMSAGVLLLCAGTKGRRKIGQNCRVMIHPVAAASMGDLVDIENETKEIKNLQKQYVSALAENTNMTVQQIKKIIKKKINVYLSAEEAVKLGIADEIV